jgi:hypothetical protein
MANYIKDIGLVAVLIAFMIFVGFASASTVINQVDITGSGLVSGQTNLVGTDGMTKNMYSDSLFTTNGRYIGTNYQGASGYVGSKQITGSNIHYLETIGYQGVKVTAPEKTETSPELTGDCAPTNVDYKSVFAGSDYMLNYGSIKTGSQYEYLGGSQSDTSNIGYVSTANGNGAGTVWNSVNEMYGQLANCGDNTVKTLTQTGDKLYSNSYTAMGNIDVMSIFKFSW